MTQRLASLPMYLANTAAVTVLWDLLRQRLKEAGLRHLPLALTWPQDYHAHWLETDLLLSQSCGYPFTDDLAGKVQLVGCFAYDAPQCAGIQCASVLVARQEHAGLQAEGFRGMRAAFNAPNSQSGYNAFRAWAAPLALGGRFFSSTLETGGHSASVQAVRTGLADLASIDCVTYTALSRYTPAATQGLCIVGTTPTYPGLPLITSNTTAAAEIGALQAALRNVLASDEATSTLEALGMVGFETPDPSIYQRCVDMRKFAEDLAYPTLV
ncbi:MAG: phosphate/phosphite/phosphonate ABC transporter substrate-binding protein [Rhodoferax sp.]